jgi:hypothetical protein
MSEVEVTDQQAPAEELVDLILSGELHAANQKYNSIIESKVIEAIEEEKHKISQTLFAEDEEEADEGKIPPQFLKGKDKDDDDDSDDDDDDDSDDDDSDSNDSDDDDDDDDDKPKKGKVPPQFAKKDEAVEPVDELSSDLLGRASDKADKQSQDASFGVGETGKEKDYKKQDTALAKKKGIQSRKFERGAADASNREAIAKNRAIAAQQSKNEDLSFDPGEASANVELPKDSFVQSVADHLGGKRI